MKKFKIVLDLVTIMTTFIGIIGMIISTVAIFGFDVTQPTGVLFYFTVFPLYATVNILIVCLIAYVVLVIYVKFFNKK